MFNDAIKKFFLDANVSFAIETRRAADVKMKKNYNKSEASMLNPKLKSVFKIVCGVLAVVIICYIEGKYGFLARRTEKAEMAGLRILSSEFEVFGVVQGELSIVTDLLTLSMKSKICLF